MHCVGGGEWSANGGLPCDKALYRYKAYAHYLYG